MYEIGIGKNQFKGNRYITNEKLAELIGIK